MVLIYLAALSLLVVYYFHSKFKFWANLGVPQNSQYTPLGDMSDVGRKYNFFEKITLLYSQAREKGQPIFGFYALTKPIALVTDLELLKLILVKDFSHFVDREFYHDEEADPISAHLFALEGNQWRRLRAALTPTFTSGKIKSMFHIVEAKGRDFVDLLLRSEAQPLNMKDTTSRYTADVIASIAFGLETNALTSESSYILAILKDVFDHKPRDIIYFMLLGAFPDISHKLKLRMFPKLVNDFFAETIRNTVKHRDENGVQRSDFLNMLINLMRKGTIHDSGETNEADRLTFNEILAQAFLFFIAGYETSSTAISYAFYFLAKYPEVQQRLREEIREVKSKHAGKLTYEGLSEMPYMNQVFNETMRLYPPAAFLLRKCTSDYKIPGTSITIPKGTSLQVPTHSIHRDPEYYSNPNAFDPDRFSPEETEKRPALAFLPFGEGPRNCIGSRWAHLQSKYGIAVAVENFELTVSGKTEEPVGFESAKKGIWVSFKKL